MNEVEKKILEHLSVPGHPERQQCLNDLLTYNKWLGTRPVDQITTINFPLLRTTVSGESVLNEHTLGLVRAYLQENPRGFCTAGINRFKKAIGLEIVPEMVHRHLHVTLDVSYDRTEDGGGHQLNHIFEEALKARGHKNVSVRKITSTTQFDDTTGRH